MKENIIMIGDFGKDLDDEHSLVLAAGLQKRSLINLVAVVANLKPTLRRAQLAKGTLTQLGLSQIPVGAGMVVFQDEKSYDYEIKVPYLVDELQIDNGQDLLTQQLKAAKNESITLVLQSGLTDAAVLALLDRDLFLQKVSCVTIMGGVETQNGKILLDENGFMKPNNASNNSFDWKSTVYLYQTLQELGVPIIITTRNVSYACQVPLAFYDKMVETGNPVGRCLKERQNLSLQKLWETACLPAGHRQRGTLPKDRNRQWLVDVFCNGKDPGISPYNEIWPFVGQFNLYDPINLIVTVKKLRNIFFDPTEVIVKNTVHLVVGISPKKHGIKNTNKLRQFICNAEIEGLN